MENRMNARKPKVSVITATYNDRENLRRIIRQVVSQSYDNIEYIIVRESAFVDFRAGQRHL